MENSPANPKPQISAPAVPQSGILRLKEVCKITGLGRSFIYQLQAQKQFPHSIKISARAVGWLESDVRQWIDSRVRASRPNV